jgi:hypothetical protein
MYLEEEKNGDIAELTLSFCWVAERGIATSIGIEWPYWLVLLEFVPVYGRR